MAAFWHRLSPLVLFLFGGFALALGVVTALYALPQADTTHTATVVAENYNTSYVNNTRSTSWDITLDVDGVGTKVADSHAFYSLAKGGDLHPKVTVGLHGSRVASITYAGRTFKTSLASQGTEIISTIVLGSLGVLLVGAGFVRRHQGP